MGNRDFSIERATFVGRCDGDVVTFVCLDGGDYGIVRADSLVGVWETNELDACLQTFLRMIDRPADVPDVTAASSTAASA